MHSFVSFEILPLVEFQLDEGISDKEAMMLIESSSSKSKDKHVKEDVLTMDDSSSDPFGQKLFSFQQEGDIFEPVIVGRSALQSMQPGNNKKTIFSVKIQSQILQGK